MSLKKTTASAKHFESLDSTNAEAIRQLGSGYTGALWIVADEQTSGRGRCGRRWDSPKGNLYASLLLRLNASAGVATQLSFVAALAAYDAIASFLPPARFESLRLKWPNDVMLGSAKVAGILIESLPDAGGNGLAAIVGIGINVSTAPAGTGRPVAALGSDPAACPAVFQALASAFEIWLSRWDEGRGFGGVREAWLAHGHEAGEPIGVSLNGTSIQGRFRGVDQRGALQLETEPGVVITVNAGDIHTAAQSRS
ncbi:MAG: biotin--[acetyl-CoA-carboxylase] ligase [Rhodomicrobium sp.]